MHLISRLRDEADLKYISQQNPTGKKGRPRKYEGKIILYNAVSGSMSPAS